MSEENWHSSKINELKYKSIESLIYIRDDALAAAKAGDSWNPKAGQYWDEYHYACMELKRRQNKVA
jgi:hypothetical protein